MTFLVRANVGHLSCERRAIHRPFHSIEESPRAIFEPVAGSEWSKVHAEAQGRHSLKDVVAEMPPEVREALGDTFRGSTITDQSDARRLR